MIERSRVHGIQCSAFAPPYLAAMWTAALVYVAAGVVAAAYQIVSDPRVMRRVTAWPQFMVLFSAMVVLWPLILCAKALYCTHAFPRVNWLRGGKDPAHKL